MRDSEQDANLCKLTLERVTRIVMDNIFYAKRNPAQLRLIALRHSISDEAALAAMIADQIIEEFDLTLRD